MAVKKSKKGKAKTEVKIFKPLSVPKAKDPTLKYQNSKNTGRGALIPAEYDLTEVGRLEDVESYVRQAFEKKTALMFKEGWYLRGKNPKTIKYITARLQQIARASNNPTEQLFRDIGRNLFRMNNAHIIKVRDRKSSGGIVRKDPNKKRTLEPVAAYFSAGSETMQYKINDAGKLTSWQQVLPNGTIGAEWSPDNVIHFFHDRKQGFMFGTPLITPVIDDIRALRKIEENLEILVYQHLFPIFQYKIGDMEHKPIVTEDGKNEMDVAKEEIQYMPSEGGIVTPGWHEIHMVGAEGKALRAEGILEHFKKRVHAGLGISGVDLGEGACYTEDTQTLTESGWKYHHEIDHTKERIAAYNPDTGLIEFLTPNFKYEGAYSGNLVRFKGQHVDITVTPEHDMWAASRFSPDKWEKVKAIDIAEGRFKSSEFYLLESAPFEESGYSQEQEKIYIPAAKMKRGKRPKPIECATADFAALMGFYLAEGCLDGCNGRYRAVISQNSNRWLPEICEIAAKTGISFSVHHRKNRNLECSITMYGKTLYQWIEQNCPGRAPDKRIPRQSFSWPLEARKAMLDTMCLGDGTEDLGSRNGFFTYYTSSRGLADDVQELAISVGYMAKVVGPFKPSNPKHRDMWRTYITQKPRNRKENSRLLNVAKHVSVVPYTGTIYCYNVDNHLFLTRKNGKTTIQGNTVNRATSQTMSQNLVDSVKDLQRVMEIFINEYMIAELLLESAFEFDPLEEENIVRFKFYEVDIDAKVKKETHFADMFAKNVVDLNEARAEAGREPIELPTNKETESDPYLDERYPQWYRTYWKLVQEPTVMIQAMDEPFSAAAKVAASNNSLDVTKQDVQGAQKASLEKMKAEGKVKKELEVAKQKAKPKQVKTKDAVVEETFSELRSYVLSEVIKNTRQLTPADLGVSPEWIQRVVKEAFDAAIVGFQTRCKIEFLDGYRAEEYRPRRKKAGEEEETTAGPSLVETKKSLHLVKYGRALVDRRIERYVHKLSRDVSSQLSKHMEDTRDVDILLDKAQAVFDSLRYRARFIEDVERRKAKNLGRLASLQNKGYSTYEINCSDDPCDRCKYYDRQLFNISLQDGQTIPPFHAGCECEIVISEAAIDADKKGDEKPAEKTKNDADVEKDISATKSDLRQRHPNWTEKQIKSAALVLAKARKK